MSRDRFVLGVAPRWSDPHGKNQNDPMPHTGRLLVVSRRVSGEYTCAMVQSIFLRSGGPDVSESMKVVRSMISSCHLPSELVH